MNSTEKDRRPMMVLRVRTATELTAEVLSLCRGEPGVAEVAVYPKASTEPPGDIVVIHAARESVGQLLDQLKVLGVPDEGTVTVWTPDLAVGKAVEDAEEAAPGDSADAVIWDELEQRTGSDSRLTWQFLAFLVAATHLAGIGIVTNSSIAIVGAMVVGPEFGPLAALAYALVERRWRLARQAALALLVGFPIAMASVALAAAVSVPLGLYTPETAKTVDSAVEFIYHPGPYSFIVAVIAGAVGMISLIGNKSAVLVGVFISVTTVPAAGYVAVALVLGEQARAAGSALQLSLNLAGIVTAGIVVLLVYRTLTPKGRDIRSAGRPRSGLGRRS
jgi:uncharacterized hydrophobic protein (TIGR00271 family)